MLILAFYCVQIEDKKWLSMGLFIILIFFLFPGKYYYYYAFIMGSIIKTLPPVRSRAILISIFFFGCLIGSYDYSNHFSQLSRLCHCHHKSVYNLVGAFLILYTLQCGLFKNFFESKFLVWLGEISYSLYLLHFIVIFSFSYWLFIMLMGHLPFCVVIVFDLLLTTILIFTASILFEKYVDRSAIVLAKRLSK